MRCARSIALGLVLGWALAPTAFAVEPDAPEHLVTRLDAASYEVQKHLAKPFRSASDHHKRDHGALVEFYAEHEADLVWVDENGLKPKARSAIAELKRAADYGLNPADYTLPAEIGAASDDGYPAIRLANLELMMSRAALAYARDARGGRIVPGELSKYLDPTLALPKPIEVMEKMAELDDPASHLRTYHPRHPQFEALRQKLIAMRGSKEPRKRVVIPRGPIFKSGARHKQIILVRERLGVPAKVTDDNPKAAPELYDAALVEVVTSFQKTHGLNPEGILGPATRRAMNARPKNRIKTILANMERWRWIQSEPGALNVQVNVPEFRFRVLEDEKVIHAERVVVGKLKNQTPIFSDEMEYIAFNPYWNVPNSIKVKELLPQMARSTGWFGNSAPQVFARNGLRVKYRGRPVDPGSVDWGRVDIRRYHIYQPPGGPNVLGVVKFMFPNKHSVYMHDTTSKSLFERSVRAYSHGCIRTRNPRRLAELILKRDSGWTMGRINKTIAAGKNHHVKLTKKIPVHITYFTARVDDDDQVVYFKDVYGHDRLLAAALRFPADS